MSVVVEESIRDWEKRWEEKRTGWHENNVNQNLIKHIDWLTKSEDGKRKKIFVPLCGQTHDLLYLLQLGHEVFGIEAVHECIPGLEERDGLKFTYDQETSVYQTQDGKLKIFVGDFFECPIENFGPFDAIWDRASFVAVAYSQRKAYIEVMRRSVTSPNGKAQICISVSNINSDFDLCVFVNF